MPAPSCGDRRRAPVPAAGGSRSAASQKRRQSGIANESAPAAARRGCRPSPAPPGPRRAFPIARRARSRAAAAGSTPSKPRMRKAPQRVGKSASAIFFTISNPIVSFYVEQVERADQVNDGRIRISGFCVRLRFQSIAARRASDVLDALVPRRVYIDWVVDNKLILITLLVKLGVAAAVASALARARTFQRLLFAERRTRSQTLGLLAFFLVPLTLGVWVRITVANFLAADISFETIILLGLLLGPGWAMLGGVIFSAPAVYHARIPGPALQCRAGAGGRHPGPLRRPEEIWGFTPFIDLSLYRWVRRNLRQPRFDRQFLMLLLIVAVGGYSRVPGSHVPRTPVCAGDRFVGTAGAGVAERARGGGHRIEGVERAAAGNQAGGTEAPAAGSAAGRAADGRSIHTFCSIR